MIMGIANSLQHGTESGKQSDLGHESQCWIRTVSILSFAWAGIGLSGRDRTEVISLIACREAKYVDYLAGTYPFLQKERLDDRGVYCPQCGCLEEGAALMRCGEKGFVLLDITEGKIHTEFVPIAKRMLHEVKVEVDRRWIWRRSSVRKGMCERYLIGGSDQDHRDR